MQELVRELISVGERIFQSRQCSVSIVQIKNKFLHKQGTGRQFKIKLDDKSRIAAI